MPTVHRRLISALIPVVVIVAGMAGIPITEDVLGDFSDKVVVAAMAALNVWSLISPRKA